MQANCPGLKWNCKRAAPSRLCTRCASFAPAANDQAATASSGGRRRPRTASDPGGRLAGRDTLGRGGAGRGGRVVASQRSLRLDFHALLSPPASQPMGQPAGVHSLARPASASRRARGWACGRVGTGSGSASVGRLARWPVRTSFCPCTSRFSLRPAQSSLVESSRVDLDQRCDARRRVEGGGWRC